MQRVSSGLMKILRVPHSPTPLPTDLQDGGHPQEGEQSDDHKHDVSNERVNDVEAHVHLGGMRRGSGENKKRSRLAPM